MAGRLFQLCFSVHGCAFYVSCEAPPLMQCQPQLRHTGRFNERLVLSLASNPACILMDDELNILPTSSHVANIKPLPRDDDGADVTEASTACRQPICSQHGCAVASLRHRRLSPDAPDL